MRLYDQVSKLKAGANELLLQLARGGRGGHGGHRLQHRRRPVHRITQRLRGPLPPLVELGGGKRLGVAVALDDGFEHGVLKKTAHFEEFAVSINLGARKVALAWKTQSLVFFHPDTIGSVWIVIRFILQK